VHPIQVGVCDTIHSRDKGLSVVFIDPFVTTTGNSSRILLGGYFAQASEASPQTQDVHGDAAYTERCIA
jgi:hypothetical protein